MTMLQVTDLPYDPQCLSSLAGRSPEININSIGKQTLQQGGWSGRVRKSASVIDVTISGQLGTSLRHNITVQMTDANFLTRPTPPPCFTRRRSLDGVWHTHQCSVADPDPETGRSSFFGHPDPSSIKSPCNFILFITYLVLSKLQFRKKLLYDMTFNIHSANWC